MTWYESLAKTLESEWASQEDAEDFRSLEESLATTLTSQRRNLGNKTLSQRRKESEDAEHS